MCSNVTKLPDSFHMQQGRVDFKDTERCFGSFKEHLQGSKNKGESHFGGNVLEWQKRKSCGETETWVQGLSLSFTCSLPTYVNLIRLLNSIFKFPQV